MFDFNDEQVVIETPKKAKELYYKPSTRNGKDGIYQSIIRWMPSTEDEFSKRPWVEKRLYYLINPLRETPKDPMGMYVDDPSEFHENPLIQVYYKLGESKNPEDQLLQKKFSFDTKYISLIQVIQDPQKPELEKEILYYQYGKKIFSKIMEQIKPDEMLGGDPHNPFKVFDAKLFALKIKKVGEWDNPDASAFVNKTHTLLINDNGIERPVTRTESDNILLYNKVNAAPKLSAVKPKAWDEKTWDFVQRYINFHTEGHPLFAKNPIGQRVERKPVVTTESESDFKIEQLPSKGEKVTGAQSRDKATTSQAPFRMEGEDAEINDLEDIYSRL